EVPAVVAERRNPYSVAPPQLLEEGVENVGHVEASGHDRMQGLAGAGYLSQRLFRLADAGSATCLQADQRRAGEVAALVFGVALVAEVDAADGEAGHDAAHHGSGALLIPPPVYCFQLLPCPLPVRGLRPRVFLGFFVWALAVNLLFAIVLPSL